MWLKRVCTLILYIIDIIYTCTRIFVNRHYVIYLYVHVCSNKSNHQVILVARLTFRPWCKPWHLWCLAAKTRGTSNTHHLDTSAPTQCVATLVETPAICTIHSRFAAPPERWRDFLTSMKHRKRNGGKELDIFAEDETTTKFKKKEVGLFLRCCFSSQNDQNPPKMNCVEAYNPESPKETWPWLKVINLCHYVTMLIPPSYESLIHHFCLRPGVAHRRCRCRHSCWGHRAIYKSWFLTKHWNR